MIRLPNTGTYSLELITAQNGAQSVVSYSDATSSAYTGGTQVASITSATTTTICSTPAASTVRDVDQINIKNTFAGSHTITVQVDANGTNYPLIVAALLTDESLNYTHGSGWQVKDANGNTKNSALSAMTSAQLAAILTDETGSGAAVFGTSPTIAAPTITGTLTATGNAALGDAEATDTHAIKGATTLLANSASAALTVTQTGAGNALVVAGGGFLKSVTDISRVVPANNSVSIIGDVGSSVNRLYLAHYRDSAATPNNGISFISSRGSETVYASLASGDSLGNVQFGGDTGAALAPNKANITASTTEAWSGTANGARITFSVTANTTTTLAEKMRIDHDGTTTLGGRSTAPALSVIPVASQTRWVTVTGSNGSNPIIGSSGGAININPGGNGTSLQVATAGASTVNYAEHAGATTGNSPYIAWTGSDTNVSGIYYTKGTGGHIFSTNSGSTQVQINHTASATRYITLTGSNGGNPTIGVSGGSLDLGAPIVLTGQTVGTTVGAAGAGAALPATPLGYITTSINGTACKIPYYNT